MNLKINPLKRDSQNSNFFSVLSILLKFFYLVELNGVRHTNAGTTNLTICQFDQYTKRLLEFLIISK